MFDQEEKRPPRPSKDDTDAVAQLPVGSAVVEEIEIQTDSDNLDGETTAKSKDEALPASLPPYSAFTHGQKISITILVSFLAVISPLSGQIYLPALESLANDLNVPVTYINLTITTFMIFQGVGPSFIANFSDIYGRRPAYLICFSLYVVANIGLALQDSYSALMVLRCLQSFGSSATIALSNATVADLVTRAERGKFIGYAAMGVTLGPALGPVAGGLLTQFYGWRGVFWFLVILSSVLFVIMLCFLPETCRSVVGNGSVPGPFWNRSLLQSVRLMRLSPTERAAAARQTAAPSARKRPNPFAALKILLEREGGVTLGCGSLLASGYFMVLTTLAVQLSERFGFTPIQIGLCYLPLGFGTLSSRWTVGHLLDWNFRRWARKLGITIDLNRQQSLDEVPIEKIRLQISICAIYVSCVAVVVYGWTMQSRRSLAGIELSLFFMGLFFSGAMNAINTLIVDTHPESPATAVAANNLFRCLVSSGATAIALPLINAIGIGWTSVVIAGVWLCFSPLLWLVMFRGAKWRKDEREAKEREQRQPSQVV